MRIRIFQSREGDCLLLEGGDGTDATDAAGRILCDGGRSVSMRAHAAPYLSELREAGAALDLVYVSHIDQDHIEGVEHLLESAVRWMIHDFHRANGDNGVREPDVPRPPEIRNLWHNAFRDQVAHNLVAEIEELMAASAPVLLATGSPELVEAGRDMANVAASIPQALRVSRYAGAELLNIPLNKLAGSPDFDGKLLMVRDGQSPETFGSLRVTVVGPTKRELDALRRGWNNWLETADGRNGVRAVREQIARRLREFEARLLEGVPAPSLDLPGMTPYKGVTTPNIASLLLLVEEGEGEDRRRVLLTGDSHPDMILDGLEKSGVIGAAGDPLHVDVLKFPHHGSEHNMTREFGRRVSADHYLFCGDGSNSNPEITVLDQVYKSRLGPASYRARAPIARDRPFAFWFSTHPDVPGGETAHLRRIVEWAGRHEERSGGLLTCHFNREDVLDLTP